MSELPPPPPPPPPDEGPPAAAPPPTGGPTGGSSYGAAPPPPGGGYGGASERPYSAPDAFSYGWAKFKAKPGDMLVPVLVVVVAIVVLEVIIQVLLRATLLGTHDCTRTILGTSVPTTCGPGFVVSLIGAGIAGFFVSIVSQVLGAGLIKNGLNIADGKPASVGEVFAWASKPGVITTAVLVAAITAVGTILCYLPGLVAGFLLNWAMFYVVDKDLAPMDAIKQSVAFATGHLAETLVFYVLGVVAIVIGAILCLVGLLVTAPVLVIGAAYTFRRLNNEPVTAAT